MSETKGRVSLGWPTVVYIAVVILIGIPVIYYSFANFLSAVDQSNLRLELTGIIILIVMTALCMSMPIYVRKDEALDISIITVYASLLLKGPHITIVVISISMLFSFAYEKSTNTAKHLFNTPIYKTLFNISELAISIYVGSIVFELLGGKYGNIKLPDLILPSIGYLLTCFMLSMTFIAVITSLVNKIDFWMLIKSSFLALLPNLIATAPVGFFIAWFFNMEGGPYIAVLFFIPLMFARYAFKLYLDSKTQFYNTVSALSSAIEARDKYTEGHSRRVEMYAEKIAKQMHLHNQKIDEIKVAALLHDIGKIGIEDIILNKPHALTSGEWNSIKGHPMIGHKILEDIQMPELIRDIVLYHHVHYDGTGYPERTHDNKELHIGVFIVAVADAFDAMTSDRPYRSSMTSQKAIDIIKANSGTQFHPKAVQAFLEVMEIPAEK